MFLEGLWSYFSLLCLSLLLSLSFSRFFGVCACVRVSVCVIYLFCLILKCYQETLLSALDLRALALVLSTLWLLPSLCARLCRRSLCPASTSCPPHL